MDVAARNGGILASVGLQLLGLGPIDVVTWGLVLQLAFGYGALSRGEWWWAPPTAALFLVFVSLFLRSLGLDEVANPRMRERAG